MLVAKPLSTEMQSATKVEYDRK